MKFVVLISLAVMTGCAYLPYIAEETLEIIEEVVEIEEHRNIALKWYEEDSEEAAEFREKFLDGFALRIKKVKWPWGIA